MSFPASSLKRAESRYFSSFLAPLGSAVSSPTFPPVEKNLQPLFEACIQSSRSGQEESSSSLSGRVTPLPPSLTGVFICGQQQDPVYGTVYEIHLSPSREPLVPGQIRQGATKTGVIGGEVWVTRGNGEPLELCPIPTITVETKKDSNEDCQVRSKREIGFLNGFKGKRGIAQIIGSYCYESYGNREPIIVMVMPCYSDELFPYLQKQPFHLRPLHKQRQIQLDLLTGLAEIHRAGVVHRDIKPENLFVNETEDSIEAVIGDFDQAVSLNGDRDACRKFIGTDEYLAPEYRKAALSRSEDALLQVTGPPIDVWGMGISFYQMLDQTSLKLPPTKKLINSSKRGLTGFTRPKNEDSFEYLVWKLLQINPQDRFTAEQALAKLGSVMQEEARVRTLAHSNSALPQSDEQSVSTSSGEGTKASELIKDLSEDNRKKVKGATCCVVQ